MGNTQSSILRALSVEHTESITFWLISLGSGATTICRSLHEQTQITETIEDDLGLSRYVGGESRVVRPGVPTTYFADRESLDGLQSSHCFPLIHYTQPCGCENLHVPNSPRHSRRCLASFYAKSAQEIRTHIEKSRPAVSGTLVPVVVTKSEEACTVLLRDMLNAITLSDDRSPTERRTTAPLVVLLQSNYRHRTHDTEGLLNSLAIQSEILNRKLDNGTPRTSRLRGDNDSWPDFVSLAITSTAEADFDSLVAAFIKEHLLDTQKLQIVLKKVDENQQSVDRKNVAAVSIPKVRLFADGFVIPTIDDSDTPYEDDQRLLLNSGLEKGRLNRILYTTCWSNGNFISTLPMGENYVRDVLVGYVLNAAQDLERRSPIPPGEVTDALSSAMVMYGPLGFTESESFERECTLDTDHADELRQIGGKTTEQDLAEVLASAAGRRFKELLMEKEKNLADLCAEARDSAYPPLARNLAILDFVRAVLNRCEISTRGGDAWH